LAPEEIFFGFALASSGTKREPEEIFFGFTWNRVECSGCGISPSSEEIFFGYDHHIVAVLARIWVIFQQVSLYGFRIVYAS
jgi:hypothetical protein